MAHVTGSATDWDDLLNDLITFLTTNSALVAANQNWVVEKEETTAATASGDTGNYHDVYLRGPGLAQQDNVHVNIRSYERAPTSVYNWEIRGATAFQTAQDFNSQPGINPNPSYFALANAQIDYEFMANGRRFIVIAFIAGDTYISYNGLLLPYGTPSEYPYPLYVSGTVNSRTNSIDVASTQIRNCYKYLSNLFGCSLRATDGAWVKISNETSVDDDEGAVWPWNVFTSSVPVRGNLDGSFTLLPGVVYFGSNVAGDFQGLFFTPKTGVTDLAAGDTITIGADVYVVLQNAKSTEEYGYAAVLRG